MTLDALKQAAESPEMADWSIEGSGDCKKLLDALGVHEKTFGEPALYWGGITVTYNAILPPETLLVRNGEEYTVYMLGHDGRAYSLRIPGLIEWWRRSMT